MNRIRIRALTLAPLALCGLTAFMAAGASANWLISGKEVEENKALVSKAHTLLELDILGSLNLEIRCTTLKGAPGLGIQKLSEKASGKVEFTGCSLFTKTDLKGEEQPKCKPSEPILVGGVALIVLLAKTSGGTLNNYILFGPEAGKPLSVINFPEACALVSTSNVTGSFVAECGTLEPANTFTWEDCKTERALHLLRAGPKTWFESNGAGGHKEIKDEIKFGANTTDLLGLAAVELASKESWCGHV